jgi:hypothetical protein
MALRAGVYIVPTNRLYIERTVWLIAGIALSISTALAPLVQPLWVLGVVVTGLVSIQVGITGFCAVGNVLQWFGFTPMLGDRTPRRWSLYRTQTDKCYLERRIYVALGINISVPSWCSCRVNGGHPSRFSSAERWCGLPPLVIA